MKNLSAVFAAVSAITLCGADCKLPVPDFRGGMTLNQALSLRKTVRAYEKKVLTPEQISQVLWSAYGFNREDKRTVPTARNKQEISIYLLTAKGAWLYEAKTNTLIEKSSSDLRRFAGRFAAPAYLVIVSNTNITTAAERARFFATMDVGYVSQDIYLAAAANGLGTCAIGMIANPKALAQALKLNDAEIIMLAHSLGIPKKN